MCTWRSCCVSVAARFVAVLFVTERFSPKTCTDLHSLTLSPRKCARLPFSYFPVRLSRISASFSLCAPSLSWFFLPLPSSYLRSGAEGDGRDFDAGGINANGSPSSNMPTPLDSPTDGGGGRGGGGAVNARGYGSEEGGLVPLPGGPPPMERVNSSSSLTG